VNKVLDALAEQWLYDVSVLSQGWVMWLVFPAMLYFMFMIVKWLALTLPVWLPSVIILGAWKSK
jgi:hypothetical protein